MLTLHLIINNSVLLVTSPDSTAVANSSSLLCYVPLLSADSQPRCM